MKSRTLLYFLIVFLVFVSTQAHSQSAKITTKFQPQKNTLYISMYNVLDIKLNGVNRDQVYIVSRFCKHEFRSGKDLITLHPKINPKMQPIVEIRLKSDTSKIIGKKTFDIINPKPRFLFHDVYPNSKYFHLYIDSLNEGSKLRLTFVNNPELNKHFKVKNFELTIREKQFYINPNFLSKHMVAFLKMKKNKHREYMILCIINSKIDGPISLIYSEVENQCFEIR